MISFFNRDILYFLIEEFPKEIEFQVECFLKSMTFIKYIEDIDRIYRVY